MVGLANTAVDQLHGIPMTQNGTLEFKVIMKLETKIVVMKAEQRPE